jgi:4-hydroxybenzoate polyprenyltransferase
MRHLSFLLKLSRPGLWFPTIWLYILPLEVSKLWEEPLFWFGLLYVTFPLNLLVYGFNDLADQEIDQKNPRKDNLLFGARGSIEELKWAIIPIIAMQVPFWSLFLWSKGLDTLLVCGGILFFVCLYNLPKYGLRNIPVLDLLCQVGYLLIVPLSCLLNEAEIPSIYTWVYLFLFCSQSQLIGEIMDIIPDRESGRTTTATMLGRKNSKLFLLLVVFIEILLVFFHFKDTFFTIFLSVFWIWLWVDLLLIFKEREYKLSHFRLFALGSNVTALFTMIYLQWNSVLQ